MTLFSVKSNYQFKSKIMSKANAIVDQRLDRIETKIDKLAEAIVSIARAEEKLVQLENDKKFLMDRMLKAEDKLVVHDKKIDDHTGSIGIITRLSWITISAVIAGVATTLFTLIPH